MEEFSGALPARPTTFVGRERELAEVRRLFAQTRLLTLSGVGGVGKTRLAIEVAAGLRDEFPEGICFIDLAPLADPQLLIATIAHAFGLRDAGKQPLAERLERYLRPRKILLVLDNCEHMVGACARLAESLLQACPHLRILATSRQPFRSAGEIAWRVPSLTVPEGGNRETAAAVMSSESARLFVERARSVRPDFVVRDTAPAIATICRRLDGIPLALELAAARVSVLNAEEIARRLSDRFQLLTHGSLAALPRHQTLRGMIDWSHELLSGAEQTLFRRLSVFPGGFALQVAEAVCAGGTVAHADVFDLLARLVDKSLVIYEERDSEIRYRLLETIREYGRERLPEAREDTLVRGRHRDYFLALAERMDREQHGPELGHWLARLELELDNFRAALDWCYVHRAADAGLRMADALFRFWDTRGHLREGRDWLVKFLSLPGAPDGVRARALGSAGYLALWLGERVDAAKFGDQGLALARMQNDRLCLARVARQYGFVLLWEGRLEAAAAVLGEAANAAREASDRSLLSLALANLGDTARLGGDYERAERLTEQALVAAREQQDPWATALAVGTLGRLAHSRRDYERATTYLRESLVLRATLQDRRNVSVQLETLGHVAAATGKFARAAALLAAAETLRESIGISLVTGLMEDHDRAVARSRSHLGERVFLSAWAAGAAQSIAAIIDYALSSDPRPPRTAVASRRVGSTVAPGRLPLTPRECEVAVLIARGLTSRQIAKQLYIAERTVETHIEHILSKLGAHSRTQIAAWAFRQDLVDPRSD